jgi:hypothetical protein
VCVEIKGTREPDRPLATKYSGFSHDGSIRSHEALRLLPAIQVGMLAEARLELNLYNLLHRLGKPAGKWIGGAFQPSECRIDAPARIDAALEEVRKFQVFREVSRGSGWMDVVRSEFHERELRDSRERVLARRELEFVIPNPAYASDASTNSVSIAPVVRDSATGKYFLGLRKINQEHSQFPSVQNREGHSGLVSIATLRLPASIAHAQAVSAWIAGRLGVPEIAVKKLGEGYFPSLGVLPDRVFPYVVTEQSSYLRDRCDFYPLEDVFARIRDLCDANAMITTFRLIHALQIWPHG